MMNALKPGDLVRFIDDVGEGRVVRILTKGMVEIRTNDGWEMPVLASRLVYIPEGKPSSPAVAVPPVPTQSPRAPKTSRQEYQAADRIMGSGLFLAVTRTGDEAGEFAGVRLQLINDTAARLIAVLYELMDDQAIPAVEDVLEPGLVLLLNTYPLARLAELNGFLIQGILIPPDQILPDKPIDFQLPFQVRKWASPGSYQANDYLDEPAQLFRLDQTTQAEEALTSIKENLTEKLFQDYRKEKAPIGPAKPRKGSPDRIPVVVDLHINKLVDSVVGLSNSEILTIQMARFRSELEAAIIDNEREIIFIHGIGNGTLKTELRKTVDEGYEFCHYEDASYRDYGFGATRVLIRQNKKV